MLGAVMCSSILHLWQALKGGLMRHEVSSGRPATPQFSSSPAPATGNRQCKAAGMLGHCVEHASLLPRQSLTRLCVVVCVLVVSGMAKTSHTVMTAVPELLQAQVNQSGGLAIARHMPYSCSAGLKQTRQANCHVPPCPTCHTPHN